MVIKTENATTANSSNVTIEGSLITVFYSQKSKKGWKKKERKKAPKHHFLVYSLFTALDLQQYGESQDPSARHHRAIHANSCRALGLD
jgi:hypothetical protein